MAKEKIEGVTDAMYEAAMAAGMYTPGRANMRDIDPDLYPHYFVFCKAQTQAGDDRTGYMLRNAHIVATAPASILPVMTVELLLHAGFHVDMRKLEENAKTCNCPACTEYRRIEAEKDAFKAANRNDPDRVTPRMVLSDAMTFVALGATLGACAMFAYGIAPYLLR